MQRSRNNRFCQNNIIFEAVSPVEAIHNGRKDTSSGIIVKWQHGNKVEMSQKSLRNNLFRSTRRSHSSHEEQVLKFDRRRVLQIVPLLMIHVLAHELNGWLSSIDFPSRHIHIVDENYSAFQVWRTVDTFQLFKIEV